MADFTEQRKALNTARSDFESARLNLSAVNARITLLKSEKAGLARAANPDNDRNRERLAALESRIDALEGRKKEQQHALDEAKAQFEKLNKGWIELESLTDPRAQLNAHFSNRIPFLLFPTRMETRFKTVTAPNSGGEIAQLWVRIYPDTCLVDSFDPQLSVQEVRNAARFWAEYHAAGQFVDESAPDPKTLDLQKAAWAFLVNLHGAGRAAWIVQAEEAQTLPGSIFPLRDSDATVILTIATEDDSILVDQAAIFDFFTQLWQAGADEVKREAVKSGFPNAEEVITKFLPINFDQPPPSGLTREEADVKIALVLLPEAVEATGKTHSWSQAARVSIAPERFVLLGYQGDNLVMEALGKPVPDPLIVGFDPNADKEKNFSPTESGDLNIPDELKWIIDFDEAVEKGMGFRITLNETTIKGLDRLFCLGVRLGADETETGGRQLVSELFEHHFYSDKGFSLVPQGTPTNNTEEKRSGFTNVDDPNETFDLYFKHKPAFVSKSDWQDKPDGQWISEWLGLDEGLFQKVLHAGRIDQADAINMNLALWPGTFGYGMEAMMSPVFPEPVINATRQFFCMFVTGRGAVPAVRIASQPYGILPTAAFRRLEWMQPRHAADPDGPGRFPFNFGGMGYLEARYLNGLYQLLLKIEADWRRLMVPNVPHASAENPTDTHQHLLDIVGLHPNSVEFYFRYMQTLEMLYSYAKLAFPFEDVQRGFDKMEFGRAYQLLQDLGYQSDLADPFPLLSKLYGLDYNWQHKVIIDTVPLSEFAPIRSYTDDNRNYIEALLDAAATSMDALRKHEGLTELPEALLFKLLKFSLEQGYFDTAVRLHLAADILTAQQAVSVRTEKPYLHMNWQGETVESRYALLYKDDDRIAVGVSVADRITQLVAHPADLRVVSPGHYQQMAALDRLKGASTARLERALVEHLDCCSYRLDAWQQGILRFQLALMRGNLPPTEEDHPVQPQQGLYIGAFGWLENVRPEKYKMLTPVEVPSDLKKDFTESYVSDDANAGYIHAPSVNQAVSAAVLRNAFLTNGKSDNNSEMAVNLSSQRIRLALAVIEGIQNGQSLAALLGYKFERMLHDQKALKDKKIDTYIFALRRQFSLKGNRMADTKVENDQTVDPDTIPISAIEARNVVHGKHLIDHVRKQTGSNKSYPFGFSEKKLPAADSTIAEAITDAVNFIMDIEDAVADLAIAESVHQVCLGNYDRAAGVLDSYSKGNYPQTPDIIRTPRSGPTLSHKVGIQMAFIASISFDALHPRKSAEPTLNQWLSAMLPAMDKLVCHVKYSDRTDGSVKREPVSMQDLQLEPIDLLYLLDTPGQAALAAIDEHVLHFVYSNKTPMLGTHIEIAYVPRPEDTTQFSLFEVMSLVSSLRALVLQSPNLKPTDLHLAGEANSQTEPEITLDKSRAQNLIDGLDTILDVDFTNNVLNVVDALPTEPTAAEAEAIRQKVDDYLDDLFAELEKLRRFGLPQTGSGHLYQRRAELIDALQEKLNEVIDRFEKRKNEYDVLAATFDNTAPDAVEQLQKMEALVSTIYSDPATISEAVVQGKKTSFDNKLTVLNNALLPGSTTGIFALLQNIRTSTADLGNFDLTAFDLSAIEDQIVRFVLKELQPFAQTTYDQGKQHTAKGTKFLVDLDTKAPHARVDLIQQAIAAILGDAFKLVPRYELEADQLFELNNSWNSTELLDYLKNDHTPPFADPVEDWLHGIARVREKMHHAENAVLLREALGLDEQQLALHPVQLPYKSEKYHWIAMPFPKEAAPDEGELLLYTALTAAAAPSPGYACGFLVDEWTEVIPTETETTGLTFHYDRPSSEAPQAFLLVTPTKLNGNWRWNDLVDALHYTLDAARLRAVEPHHIDQTPYARYLPNLLSPMTRHPTTIGMYLTALPLVATINQ
jgi:hypothetical protein